MGTVLAKTLLEREAFLLRTVPFCAFCETFVNLPFSNISLIFSFHNEAISNERSLET